MATQIQKADIEKLMKKHLFASEPGISRIPTGKFNTSFFVSTEKEDYIVRIAPPQDAYFVFYEKNMMAQEPELHRILRERTNVPVPEIYVYDTDHDIFPNDVLIMQGLPGTPASDAQFLTSLMWDKVLQQIGDFLRQVHAITAQQYGYLGAHQPMKPQDTWHEAFAIMWSKMIRQIMEIEAYSEEEGQFLLELFDTYKDVFQREVKSSLLHMDVWAQNILINSSGKVTGLLDWDRALWGDPEIEFAVLDYCSISEPSFWYGYGQERDESPEARIRMLFYFLYELQKYIIIRGKRNGSWEQAMQYKSESLRIARQLA